MQTDHDKEGKNKSVGQTVDENLKDAFDNFLQKYEPVKEKKDATTFLTTDQVYAQIYIIYPSPDFITQNIYSLMKENGFKLDTIVGDDITFYWLLKKK